MEWGGGRGGRGHYMHGNSQEEWQQTSNQKSSGGLKTMERDLQGPESKTIKLEF